MSFRVTPNISIARSVAYQQSHAGELARLREQISSGLRINRPSDDPFGTRTLLTSRADIGRLEADLGNIAATRTTLNHSFTHMQDAGLLFVRAKEIALTAQQATEPIERETLAQEVDGLLERLLAIANAEHDGEYLFAGARTDATPFSRQTASGASDVTAFHYAGSDDRAATVVGRDHAIDRIYSGREVFLHNERSSTLLLGDTGAAAGLGTDTATGSGALIVRHTSTSYAGTSGVQTGVSSTNGDTVIGPSGAHTLTVIDTSGTGAAGTVSLNGGPAIAFTNADTDLLIEGPRGEAVYIDTTGITAGFSGTVDIQADGTLSMDDGVTETAIDFTSNQVLTNSGDGSVTHIDSTGIRRAGVDTIEYGGTGGAFQSLIELRDTLRVSETSDPQEWHDAMARRIGDIDRVHAHLLGVTGEQAVSLQQLDVLQQRYESLQLEGERVASETAGADLGEAALQLQQQQTLLELTLAASARLFDQSILGYLR